MPTLESLFSRRAFVGLGGVVVVATAVPAFLGFRPRLDQEPYQVIHRWPLLSGGLGMFVAVEANPSADRLRGLGEWLRGAFSNQQNMVVQIFDDAAAAAVVRTGSRLVAEEEFAAAMTHRRASYLKDTSTARHSLTILSDSVEVIEY
jgi:hypothetical protein